MHSYIKYLLPWLFNVLYFYNHREKLQAYAAASKLKIRPPTFLEYIEQREFKDKLKKHAKRHLRLVK